MTVRRLRSVVLIMLFVAGAAMLSVGIIQGEATVVLRKAVVVCMECIGIG